MNLRLFRLLLSYILFYGSSSTSEDLMWESKSNVCAEERRRRGRMWSQPRVSIPIALSPPRTRTCVNLLPDVIKGMEPVESRAGVLSTRWYSPPRLFFYITSKPPSYFYTGTQTTQSYRADSLFNTFLPQSDQNLSTLQGFVWNLTNCSFLIPQRALCPWAFTLWV